MGDATAPVDLPYLQKYRSRGKVYAYYRRDGRQVRIRGAITAESYEAARKAWEAAPTADHAVRAPKGTIAALVESYKAASAFRQLATKTQKDYTPTLDMLVTRFGPGQVSDANRAWVNKMRDELQDKPRSGNLRVAIISAVFAHAVDNEMRPDNPAHGVKKLETEPDSSRRWTDAELDAMTGPAAGDVALPVLIARYTGQRQADVLRLPWGAYDGATITLRPSKTKKHTKADQALVLPVCAELRAALDIAPRRGLLICLTEHGKVWKGDWFRHRFAQVRAATGLPADMHYHGLRATRLTELAESGATEREIMANSGHKSTQMVQRYTKGASQRRLAEAAVVRLRPRKKDVK